MYQSPCLEAVKDCKSRGPSVSGEDIPDIRVCTNPRASTARHKNLGPYVTYYPGFCPALKLPNASK
jgi:hypothetical protein